MMNSVRFCALYILLTLVSTAAFAQYRYRSEDLLQFTEDEQATAGFGLNLGYNQLFTNQVLLDFSFSSPHVAAAAAVTFNSDQRYQPDIGNLPGGTLFDRYFLMDTGALAFTYDNNTLHLGRMTHRDIIDSPYSLFISSQPIPAIVMNYRYESDRFIYETRWVELNRDSKMTTPGFTFPEDFDENDNDWTESTIARVPGAFPDRGAVIQTVGIKRGSIRFGYQDAVVFPGRAFDLEYFINPIPSYIIQHFRSVDGRPWSADYEDKSILGGFFDWQYTDDLYLNAQVFVDDANIGGLFDSSLNPWKAAYNIGGRLDTDYGTFALHNAAAFKYTFDGSHQYPDIVYPYAYYPDTVFYAEIDGQDGLYPIPIEELMLGYYHGENNISLRLDYDHHLQDVDFGGSLEFSLSGAKSPANAWHELVGYLDDGPGSRFLNDELLEKKILFDARASRSFGRFNLQADMRLGMLFNALELQQPFPDGDPEYTHFNPLRDHFNQTVRVWRPGDSHEKVFRLNLTMIYVLPL